MVIIPYNTDETFLVCEVQCGFTHLTASFLLLGTVLSLLLPAFFFTERSQKRVVLCLGCSLAQVITPLALLRITGLQLEGFIVGKSVFWGQIGSLPTCFLVSMVTVTVLFFIFNLLEKQRLKLGKIKFELRYTPILFILFLLNPNTKDILAWGQVFTGINFTWVYLALLGVSVLLWAHSTCKAQIKEEWVLKIREQVISHIYLFILYSRLLVLLVGLLDGSILASEMKMLFCIIDLIYLKTVPADLFIYMMPPADFRSAEATPTGGAQTPSAEQNPTPMGSATVTASPPEVADLPALPPVETAATPVTQGQSAQQNATPVPPATAPIPINFLLSLGYMGLQEFVERRVLFNEIGYLYNSNIFEKILHQKKEEFSSTLQSIFQQYQLWYEKKVELDYRLIDSGGEDQFKRTSQQVKQISDMPRSFEAQILKVAEQYGQHSNVIFSAFFEKIKELDITKKEWDDDLLLLPVSEQPAVRDLILIEKTRQASFNKQPGILKFKKGDLSTVVQKFIFSKIESLSEERLQLVTKEAAVDLQEADNLQFDQVSKQISRQSGHLSYQSTQAILRMEAELQQRTVEVGKIEQLLKRGR